jgi:hypothetical protein
MSDIVIVGAKRTAIGALLGQFTGVPTPTLGAAAIQGALDHAGVAPDQVDEVIMGCVLPAGLGQAPARQAAIAAAIPASAGATTINKVCGSGMKAVMLGHDLIKAGSATVVVAGGMESMTNAPHLLNGARTGFKYGTTEMLDHMAWDGLTSPYDKQAMACSARCAWRSTTSPAKNRTPIPPKACAARRAPCNRALSRAEIVPGHRVGPQGRCRDRYRRTAGPLRHRQDPLAQAGLQEGRHDHCRRARRASTTARPRRS